MGTFVAVFFSRYKQLMPLEPKFLNGMLKPHHTAKYALQNGYNFSFEDMYHENTKTRGEIEEVRKRKLYTSAKETNFIALCVAQNMKRAPAIL